jgi:hypothetical protein
LIRCPYCGERVLGVHLSSLVVGLFAGAVTFIVTTLAFDVRWF